MFIAILGRQPEISIAELEAVYGAKKCPKDLQPSPPRLIATIFQLTNLGGTIKCGQSHHEK